MLAKTCMLCHAKECPECLCDSTGGTHSCSMDKDACEKDDARRARALDDLALLDTFLDTFVELRCIQPNLRALGYQRRFFTPILSNAVSISAGILIDSPPALMALLCSWAPEKDEWNLQERTSPNSSDMGNLPASVKMAPKWKAATKHSLTSRTVRILILLSKNLNLAYQASKTAFKSVLRQNK